MGLYVISCAKAKVCKIFPPRSYFPAYPGSYWKYLDDNNDTITSSTLSNYCKDYYTSGLDTSETYLVPFYDGTPIWGYEAHTGSVSYATSYPLTHLVNLCLKNH